MGIWRIIKDDGSILELKIKGQIDYQNFDCQNIIVVNGKKMTISEFKQLKGGI